MTEEPQVVEVTLQATNRRGKSILCKVTCTPLIGRRKEIQGAIVLMEQVAESE
jgi:two-component system CheB/CheR fusion protein